MQRRRGVPTRMAIDLGATLALEHLTFLLECMNAWWRLFEMFDNCRGWKGRGENFVMSGDATARAGVGGRDAHTG